MVEKAVEAAAPGRERSAWLQRHDDWARNARRRQEAADRAKAAQEAAAVGEIAPQAGAPRTAYQVHGVCGVGGGGTHSLLAQVV